MLTTYNRIYLITCPADSRTSLAGAQPTPPMSSYIAATSQTALPLSSAAGAKLIISPFYGPWNWGLNFDANMVMGYAWSGAAGMLIYYHSPS